VATNNQHDLDSLENHTPITSLLLTNYQAPAEDSDNIMDQAIFGMDIQANELSFVKLRNMLQELHDREITAEYEKRERLV
jgi:hypothetical protein